MKNSPNMSLGAASISLSDCRSIFDVLFFFHSVKLKLYGYEHLMLLLQVNSPPYDKQVIALQKLKSMDLISG